MCIHTYAYTQIHSYLSITALPYTPDRTPPSKVCCSEVASALRVAKGASETIPGGDGSCRVCITYCKGLNTYQCHGPMFLVELHPHICTSNKPQVRIGSFLSGLSIEQAEKDCAKLDIGFWRMVATQTRGLGTCSWRWSEIPEEYVLPVLGILSEPSFQAMWEFQKPRGPFLRVPVMPITVRCP